MSGHSKWATIKRKKGAADAARGKIFTRLIREISIVAREGGGDPEGNPRLRLAIQKAKQQNMPQENIIRGIKRGTGELEGQTFEEITYEGYGPGGCAIMVDVITDNRNRTVSEMRHLFSKYAGNLAETNAVAYMFERKAVIELNPGGKSEDDILMAALDSGATDVVQEEDGSYTVTGEPGDLEAINSALEAFGVEIISAESTFVPNSLVNVDEKHARSLIKLMDALDDHDDVQKVYSNFDIDPKLLEEE
ncbi:MAG: YebC/PmpR family DNA-binding transcriptional regulator [bacterium]